MGKKWKMSKRRQLQVQTSHRIFPEVFFRNSSKTAITNKYCPPATTPNNAETTITPDTKYPEPLAPVSSEWAGETDPTSEKSSSNVARLFSAPTATDGERKTAPVAKRKRTKRGRYSKKNCDNLYISEKFSIYLTNIQSSKSKMLSLQSIVDSLDVDLCTINETNLKKNDKFSLEGFKSFTRNRQNAHMGGIATCIKNKYSNDTLKVSQGEKEEYIVTRHGQFNPAINVINLYGSQESCQSVEEIKEWWEAIMR